MAGNIATSELANEISKDGAFVRGIAPSHAKETGKMISLKCSYEKALELLEKTKEYAVAANYNFPEQVAVSGNAAS